MSVSRLMQMAAAGAGNHPAPIFIEDVFSTYLYTGNGSTQTITNGIDLAGEGGLVWTKARAFPNGGDGRHALADTARSSAGSGEYLSTNDTNAAETTFDTDFGGFNADGYSLSGSVFNGALNLSGNSYTSWTFRKAPRFFDVVTYTGDGVAGRQISHNLGVAPGMIVVKCTNTSGTNWAVYHRSVGATKFLLLNTTNAEATATDNWNNTEPTDSVFTLGTSNGVNADPAVWGTRTYVAYLFAHDPLGPSGDGSDGLIACGSYTGNGSTNGPEINLGWEPQWLLIKNATQAGFQWPILDTMRGMPVSGADAYLFANLNSAEASFQFVDPTATGFKVATTDGSFNSNTQTYIYIAIRRGPMRQPESGTEVFAVDNGDGSSVPSFASGFPVDFGMLRDVGVDGFHTSSRLTSGKTLDTYDTAAEGTNSNYRFDYQNGWFGSALPSNYYSWMFRRAPGFFDVVAYTGNGVAGRTVPHNLGVAPELMIVKGRQNSPTVSDNWFVFHSSLGFNSANDALVLNSSNAKTLQFSLNGVSSSDFTLTGDANLNEATYTYIAYLFATLPGVSKVGSYTGNGSSQTINCGFTSGARMVLIKRTDSTGDWYVWDTARGIVTGNDPHLSLNTTAAEVTTDDSVDPEATGFIVNQDAATNINVNAASYIYLAIA